MNMDSLDLEVKNVKSKVNSLIKNSYGKDSFSFEELIAVFGSSSTTLDKLERARIQILEMQGTVLASNDDDNIDSITELMENLEKYINAIVYHEKLQSFKQEAEINYNIVKELQEEKNEKDNIDNVQQEDNLSDDNEGKKDELNITINTINKHVPVSEAATDVITRTTLITDASIYTGNSIYIDLSNSTKASIKMNLSTSEDIKEDADIVENSGDNIVQEKKTVEVINISPEEWVLLKKGQMTELSALIYDHPVNLYCFAVNNGGIRNFLNCSKKKQKAMIEEWNNQKYSKKKQKETSLFYWDIYSQYKDETNFYRKMYLDTSDIERARDLFFGSEEYFPDHMKAKTAFAFAVFLDGGAFCIGILAYLIEKREIVYRIKKNKKWLYKNKSF